MPRLILTLLLLLLPACNTARNAFAPMVGTWTAGPGDVGSQLAPRAGSVGVTPGGSFGATGVPAYKGLRHPKFRRHR